MWREKYNLGDNDPKGEEPETTSDEEPTGRIVYNAQLFEVTVYMQVELLADAKAGDHIPVRLRVRAEDFNIGAFTEVLQVNQLPYAVSPLPMKEDGED